MHRLSNQDIADHLEETGKRYEMLGVQFKPRAYFRAAAGVSDYAGSAAGLYEAEGEKALTRIPGVGPGIAKHIASMLKTGTFKEYEKLLKKAPIDVQALTALEEVGPRRAQLLWQTLKVKDVSDLKRAAKAGKVAEVKGLGQKFQEDILKGLHVRKTKAGRRLLGWVLPLAEEMLSEIRAMPGVKRAEVGGSVRRRQETIGDLDFIITASKPEAVMDRFVKLPQVRQVREHGALRAAVTLNNGMHADLLAAPDEAYGAILHHFTGSREHNIELRKIAIRKGYKMNELGLWKGRRRIACRTEEELYEKLGLPYIPPEIRTNEGEIEAARRGELPALIPYGSLKGDLHAHTDWTDGSASIETMAKAAKALGLSYMAVTDHSKALAFIGGLDPKKLARQAKEIDAANRKMKGFAILKGSECDILKDGAMDLPDTALSALDFVGASVHSHFRLTRAEQTKRVLRAMENPHVDAICHPSGRKIERREPIDLDWEAVMKAAKATGTALEVDGDPSRIDLRDENVRLAVRHGVKLVLDSDAHHPRELAWDELAIATARRGWATAKDVINSRKLPDLLKWLKTPKSRRK